jgi:inner membrane protein
MIARTHDVAAITALGIVFLLLPEQTLTLSTVIIAVLANLIGGVTPDIDQPTAPLWKNLPVGKYFGKLFDKLSGGHRFITHSLIGVVAISYLIYLLLMFLHPIMNSVNIDIVWWAFVIGILSHLIMDTLTKEGVPWLLPVPIKFGLPPIKALRITTDHWVENWVVFPLLLVFNVIFYFYHYKQILYILKNLITF